MDSALRAAALRRSRVGASGPTWLPFLGNGIALVGLLVVLSVIDPYASALRAGQVAGETIVAQQRVTYADRAATAARRSQSAAAIQPVYRTDVSLATHRLGEARGFLARASDVLQSAPASKRLGDLRALLPPDLPSNALREFAVLSPSDLDVVDRQSLSLLNQAVAWRFESHQLTAIEFGLLSTVPARVTLLQRTAIGEVLATFLAPTLLEDRQATAERRKQAAAAVKPVMETIYQGEVVVRRGDLITPAIMDRLEALGVQSRSVGWQDVTASLLFALVIVVVLFWYLYAFHSDILANRRLLLLLDAGIVLAVLGARLFANGHVILPYFLPVAAISTFAAVLIAPEA
jgi:membrane-associated HD superfamily phosphohydrolase